MLHCTIACKYLNRTQALVGNGAQLKNDQRRTISEPGTPHGCELTVSITVAGSI
jgi:hypothetical protein